MYYNQDERGSGRRGVKVLALFFAAIVISGISFLAGTLMGPLKEAELSGLEAQFPGIKDIQDFEKLFEVRETLYQTYYKDIDDSVLIEGAIKGMVDSLGDPYTVFFNAEEYSAFNEEGTGNYVGIGIMVGAKDDKIVVITTFDGTPAYEAGIRSGDVIVKVEGVEYKGSQMDQAVSIIRGEAGQAVNLTIEREGTQMDLSVVRDHIKLVNVEAEMLESGIGLVTLLQFSENTSAEFKGALDSLKAQGAKGFIVDLRGNPGGYLDESIKIASNFIKKDEDVVYTLDKFGQKKTYKSYGGDYLGVPLVVLIDEGSASASEVVAGALKDYGAATFVGHNSFGKGIVQMVYNVGEAEGLKVTVSSYYSPKGTNIHGTGIMPDVVVDLPEGFSEGDYDRLKDTQLQKALEILKGKLGN